MKDAYQILGIKKDASQGEIKSAYRKLARQYHPDIKPNDKKAEEMFKELTGAYDILSDPVKKAKYDRGEMDIDGKERAGFNYKTHHQGAGRYSHDGRSYQTHQDFDFNDFDLNDIFSSFGFGASARPRRTQQQTYSSFRDTRLNGENISYNMTVSFIDAALGCSKEVALTNGKKIKLTIPKGTVDGAVLRLKGQGMPGTGGGINGDALITIKVQPHPFFERKGDNIYLDIPVTLREAVLGGKINVPTLDGIVSVNVPKNSSSGTLLRLKGKGIPKEGDLIIKLYIVLPDKSDSDIEEFVDFWKKGSDFDPRKKAKLL